jgi:hypothetical protein
VILDRGLHQLQVLDDRLLDQRVHVLGQRELADPRRLEVTGQDRAGQRGVSDSGLQLEHLFLLRREGLVRLLHAPMLLLLFEQLLVRQAHVATIHRTRGWAGWSSCTPHPSL